MGIYFNPGTENFKESIRSEIYVDKTGLIQCTNAQLGTQQKYICVSRPRRFGKSMALKMLAAYYQCEEDAKELFLPFQISRDESFGRYMNQFDVICINMQDFLSKTNTIDEFLSLMQRRLIYDIRKKYGDIRLFDEESLAWTMQDIYDVTKRQFVILIDEWDCIFREYKQDTVGQKRYLDYLRDWLKDKDYIALAYMTGILPIKKYGTHSALNMFQEYSMTNPRQFATYMGFTDTEVQELCGRYGMSYEEIKAWYNGYQLSKDQEIYNPKSVVEAMTSGVYDDYWNQTETYEALKIYIEMNYDGLKDKIIEMLAGGRVPVNVGKFSNDMSTFSGADDVLTLLIHLGYLGYDFDSKEVYIPNKEVSMEYLNAVEGAGWNEIVSMVQKSRDLLKALWRMDESAVASGIEYVHQNTSILQYNDENALSYTINMALYYANEYYTIIRECPSGRGFADLVYIPRKKYADKPAMVVELKSNVKVSGAIDQIMERNYPDGLDEYKDNMILCGISYHKKSKKHTCRICRLEND